MTRLSIDQSILTFTPRSTYYLSLDDQLQAVEKEWKTLLEADRELFAMLMLLPSSHYSTGRMIHHLLASTEGNNPRSHYSMTVFNKVDAFLEDEIILFNLRQMPMSFALRSLLYLAGKDHGKHKLKSVNNARARRLIMNFIFDRDAGSLDALMVKFKPKLSLLTKHVFGTVDLFDFLSRGNTTVVSRYCRSVRTGENFNHNLCVATINFLHNHYDYMTDLGPLANEYVRMCDAARKGDVDAFKKSLAKGKLPYEVALGFRNTYKLPVGLADIHTKGQKSEREKLKSKEAAKKVDVDTKVDFNKQSIEDLYKYVYLKALDDREYMQEDFLEAQRVLRSKLDSGKKVDIDFGKTVVIIDESASMKGDDTRKYHPIITAMMIAHQLPSVHKLFLSTGVEVNHVPVMVVPDGETELWDCLLKAAEDKPDTVIVISDGYENTVSGMFEHVYDALKKKGISFKLLHINPVYDATVKSGKRLVKDLPPVSVENAHLFKSQLILHTLTEGNVADVKSLLAGLFNTQIGGNRYALHIGK